MRNLKRALSFALAAIMVLGLMVIGAGAAYQDFTDKDEIQHTEAVKTLTTLNVIAGKEDGSYYDPAGILTRAEMAKLVTYVLNGGTEPVLNIKATPTYSDIDNHWAEKYIEYCTSQGIIAGDGAGRFNPEGTLTGSQAAKMILVAMNYKADVFGFTGDNWEINVNKEANGAKLYDKLGGMDPSAPISRDDTAQLVYNAIQSRTMELNWDQNLETGVVTQGYTLTGASLFKDKFDGVVYEGALTASGQYGYRGTFTDDGLSILAEKKDGSTITDNAGNPTPSQQNFTWKDQDLTDLVGRYVKILYNEKTEEIYGVYPMDEYNTVIETTADQVVIDGGKVSVDGSKYDFEVNAPVFEDGNYQGTINAYFPLKDNNLSTGDTVYLISNDKDQKIDLVLVETVAVAVVNYVGTDSFSITITGGNRAADATVGNAALDTIAALNQDLEDVVVVGDALAKDDVVLVTEDYYTMKDAFQVVTPETLTVSGYNKNDYLIDGTWYKDHNTINVNYKLVGSGITSGDTVDLVAFGGICYYVKKVTGVNAVENLAFVYSAGVTNGDGVTSGVEQAKLIFADGSKATVATVNRDGDSVCIDGSHAPAGGTTDLVGHIVTYETTSSGKYILTDLSATNKAGFNSVVGNGTSGNVTVAAASGSTKIGKIGGNDLADDAVVFVMKWSDTDMNHENTGNDAKVISGKDAKTLLAADYTLSSHALTAKTNGFTYTQVATLAYKTAGEALPSNFDGKNYGYLVSDAWRSYDTAESAWYRCYKIWDGSETIEVKEKSNEAVDGMTKGNVITYDLESEGVIKNVDRVSSNTTQVTGYDAAANKIGLVGTTVTKLTSDTVILYVDSQNYTGKTDGVIREADDTSADGVITAADQANVRYVLNSTGDEIAFLLVDVNNKMLNPALLYTAGSAAINTAAKLNALLAVGNDVVITGNYTTGADEALSIPASSSLTVESGTLTLGGNATVSGALTAAAVDTNGKDLTLTPAKAEDIKVDTLNVNGGTLTAKAQDGSYIVVQDLTFTGSATLAADSKITIDSRSGARSTPTLAVASGTLTNNGNIIIAKDAAMVINAGATLTSYEDIDINGSLTNSGTVTHGENTPGYGAFWFSSTATFKNGSDDILGGSSPLFTLAGQGELCWDRYGAYNATITNYGDAGVTTDPAKDYVQLNKNYSVVGQLKVYPKTTLVIPSGVTLTVDSSTKIKVEAGGTIQLAGTITVTSGTFEGVDTTSKLIIETGGSYDSKPAGTYTWSGSDWTNG